MTLPIAVLDQLARQEDEIAKLREQRDRLVFGLRRLVGACTTGAISNDKKHQGVRHPEKEVVEEARAILAEIEGEKK